MRRLPLHMWGFFIRRRCAANQSGMHADSNGIAGCIMRTIYLYTVQACCVENLIHIYLCPYNSEHLVHVESFLKLFSYIQQGRRHRGGQGGGHPPPKKKIGTGAAPPPTKKHRNAQKNDESALRAARIARRTKGKAEEKTTVLKTEGATLYKYVYMFNGI